MPEAVIDQRSVTVATTLHEQGLAFARARMFEKAVELFQQALAADPDRIEVIRHLAQAYGDAGQLPEAEKAWLDYLARREAAPGANPAIEPTASSESNPQPGIETPTLAEAYRHLGNLRKRMDKLESAAAALQKAIALDGAAPAFQVDLGILYAQGKKHGEARQAFGRALELQSDYYDALINMGMLLQEMGEGKEALAPLRRAVELRPDDPSGLNNLGVVLSEQGQFDEAVTCYEKLLAKTPDYVLAWNNMGNALRSAGKNEEAVAALQKALELKPDYTEAYNNLGIIYAQMEQFADSIRNYDQALLLRPDYPEAHANRGLVYLLLGDFQQGWADYGGDKGDDAAYVCPCWSTPWPPATRGVTADP